jgi:hypothetical protein
MRSEGGPWLASLQRTGMAPGRDRRDYLVRGEAAALKQPGTPPDGGPMAAEPEPVGAAAVFGQPGPRACSCP